MNDYEVKLKEIGDRTILLEYLEFAIVWLVDRVWEIRQSGRAVLAGRYPRAGTLSFAAPYPTGG